MTAADSGDDAQRQASPGGPATLIARFQVDSFEPRQVTGLDAEWVGLMTFADWSGSARIVHDDQGAFFEITLA